MVSLRHKRKQICVPWTGITIRAVIFGNNAYNASQCIAVTADVIATKWIANRTILTHGLFTGTAPTIGERRSHFE
jgi:hypothetical protein